MICGFKDSPKRSLLAVISSFVLIIILGFMTVKAGTPVTIFQEGFEDGYIDGDWNQEIVAYDDWYYSEWYWYVYTQDNWGAGYPSYAYEGYYFAGIAADSYGAKTRLYTRDIDFGIYKKNAKLTFQYVSAYWGGDLDYLVVYYRTSSSDSWTELQSFREEYSEWTLQEIDLPDVNGTYQIAFEGQPNYGWGCYIDDINVTAEPQLPDATITALLSPTSPFSVGLYDVKVTLKNLGEPKMTSCWVNWTVNGASQPAYYWTGSLDQGKTADITLGTYNFVYPSNGPFNPFNINVYTSSPNGGEDGDATNDLLSKSISPILNDAGVVGIFGPPSGFPPGPADVRVRVKNFAPKPLTSVTINWSVDGVLQTAKAFTGLNVLSGQTTDLVIGNFNFNQVKTYEIWAKTVSPNTVADEVTTNDAYTGSLGPSLSPGYYTVGGQNPSFATFDDFVSYLNGSGIIGNGVVNVEVRPGQYSGQLDLNSFPHGNNTINIFSTNLDPNTVTIYHTPTNSANYVFWLEGVTNMNFTGLTFRNNASAGSNAGRIFNILTSTNLVFKNVNFYGVPIQSSSDSYNLIDLMNSNNLTFMNCEFGFGTKGVYDQNYDPCTRNITLKNNTFSGQGFAGVYMMGYTTQQCTSNGKSVLLQENVFKASSGYSPNYGIWSMDGVTGIIKNSFSGITNGNVISLNNNALNQDNVIIDENSMTTGSNANGIYLSRVYNYQVSNNQITVTGGSGNFAGLYFMNSGQGVQFPEVKKNNIKVTDGYAAYMSSTNAKIIYNYLSGTSAVAPASQSALYLDNARGYAADNFIIGQNKVGVNMVNPQGFELYYNSIITSSSISAFQYVGNNSNGAIIKRNVFHNSGTGYAMSMTNYNGFVSNENSWYTSGANFSNNYPSFVAYQNGTNQDRNSANVLLAFKSATDAHLTAFDDRIHMHNPLFSEGMYNEIEMYDYDNEWRRYANYFGADNIEPKVKLLVQPESVIACSNGTTGDATFTVMATVSFGGQPTYQWQKDGKDIPGANAAIYKILISDIDYNKSGTYTCIVGGTGGAAPVTTDEALLYVLTDPLITREPQPVIANTGETVMFEVQAHTYDYGVPVEKFSYQWYRGTLNDPLVNNDRIAGADASVLIIRDVKATDYGSDYFCVVSGLCGITQTQNTAIMLPPDVNIIEQPADNAVCEGNDAKFKVSAEIIGGGTELLYQWMKDGVDLVDGARISGVNTSELTLTLIGKVDEAKYSARVTVMPGGKNKISTDAQLTVKEKPVITTQPEATLTVQAGRELSLTVAATGTDPLGYQWYFNGNSIPGEINATITIPAATTADAGSYYCVVSNECGQIQSSESVVTVNNQNQTDVSEVSSNGYTLYTSVPNPVSDKSVISFIAPDAVNARLTLTDALGNEIAILFDGVTLVGRNDVKLDLSKLRLSSGVYYYTLSSLGFHGTMKLVVNK